MCPLDTSPPRALRVGLNLLFLGERAGGVGRYASRLPQALLEAEPQTELHLFVSRDVPTEVLRADWASAVRWHKLPVRTGGSRMHVPAQFLALPPLARASRLDILHSPANTGPVITPGLASVITLHDLIWLHRPHEWEASRRAHFEMRVSVGHCVRRATRVFTDSHAAAADIVETLGVDASSGCRSHHSASMFPAHRARSPHSSCGPSSSSAPGGSSYRWPRSVPTRTSAA